MKFLRQADAVRRPFELHLARVIEWPDSLEQAIHTSVGRVRDYDVGSGPKVDTADPEEIRAMAAMAKLISSTMLEIHGQQLSEDSIGVMQGSMAPWLLAQGPGL